MREGQLFRIRAHKRGILLLGFNGKDAGSPGSGFRVRVQSPLCQTLTTMRPSRRYPACAADGRKHLFMIGLGCKRRAGLKRLNMTGHGSIFKGIGDILIRAGHGVLIISSLRLSSLSTGLIDRSHLAT
jgi:hypothetical protein